MEWPSFISPNFIWNEFFCNEHVSSTHDFDFDRAISGFTVFDMLLVTYQVIKFHHDLVLSEVTEYYLDQLLSENRLSAPT